MTPEMISNCQRLLSECDAVLIGAGAGLTAAAGIDYTDREKFAEIFPAWVKKGFSMQYQLMGYTGWSQAEQWGYYAVHLDYVYFRQTANPLYRKLRQVIGPKDCFIITSNVDEHFHKNGFDKNKIYTPQGSYGKIQCSRPCTDAVWDIRPYFERLQRSLHPTEQYITDKNAIPKCRNCGGNMFINVRIDGTFIERPYEIGQERLLAWLDRVKDRKLLLLELGAGYSTPVVVRMPMERIALSHADAAFIRINKEHAGIPRAMAHRSLSVEGDISQFIDAIL
jgi:NAD-dependent SIR2 family protein deacetylase